ncbi:hypothetical protein K469DRAFT_581699, partial [Zopfia rhizophila CBS 207.26]
VVFVPGLGSFPDTTWQKPSVMSGKLVHNTSWIDDFLPLDLPQARLFYFNYDSTTYNDAPAKDLGDIADEMLFELSMTDWGDSNEVRMRLHNPPIIFVCHSYGGLVVKEVCLTLSVRKDMKHRSLLNSVSAIMFLGTPHFGTPYASYARALALRLHLLGSNPDIFLPLYPNSTFLQKQHSEFLKHFSWLRMTNFYETKGTVILPSWLSFPPWRVIVPKPFATFDAPKTENYGLDYDHSGLNKFNSREERGYRTILYVLRATAKTIIQAHQTGGGMYFTWHFFQACRLLICR